MVTLWDELSAQGFNSVLLPLERVFKNANAGRLASQLLYYATPGKTGRDRMWAEQQGHKWVVMTRDMIQRFMGLTEARYKAALKILEPLGVVVRRSFKDRRTGFRTTHLRLDPDRLAEVIEQDELTGCFNQTGPDKNASPYKHQVLIKDVNNVSYDTGGTPENVSGKPTSKPLTPTPETDTGNPPEISLSKEIVTCATEQTVTTYPVKVVTTAFDEKDGDTIMPTAQEQLANHAVAKAKLRAEDKGWSLYPRWRSQMAELYPAVEPVLTLKDRAILSQFAKAVGADKSIEALDFAFLNWYDFRTVVKQKKGEFIKSSEPTPGMLLRHYPQLLQLIADTKALAAPPRSPNALKPDKLPVVKVQPVPAAPAEALPTPQELEEMWAASLAAVKHKG